MQVALQLAEQLRQAGQWDVLTQYYRWAGAAFLERREPHNALAVYTLLAHIVPYCLHTHAMIAESYRGLGEAEQAAAIYERIAQTHEASGRHAEAVQVHRLVVELDPASAPRRVALAEAWINVGHTDEAFAELQQVAAELREVGRIGEYLWTAQRLLSIRPSDKPTLRQLAEVQLQYADVYGAVQTLRSLMAVSPRDDQGRELMAYAFAAQGQVQLACRCVLVLADELRGRGFGSLVDAQRVLQHAVSWNPHDSGLVRMLAEVQDELGGGGRLRRGSHVRGEIRSRRPPEPARSREPGVPEMIPSLGQPAVRGDDEDTNVLPLHRRRRRRTEAYEHDEEGRVISLLHRRGA